MDCYDQAAQATRGERAIGKLMREYQKFFQNHECKQYDSGKVIKYHDDNGLVQISYYPLLSNGIRINCVVMANFLIAYSYRELPDDREWAFAEYVTVMDAIEKNKYTVIYLYNEDLSRKEEISAKDLDEKFKIYRKEKDEELERLRKILEEEDRERREKQRVAREEWERKKRKRKEERATRKAAGIDNLTNGVILAKRLKKARSKLKTLDGDKYTIQIVYKEGDNVGYPTIVKREPETLHRRDSSIHYSDIEDAISEYISNRNYE